MFVKFVIVGAEGFPKYFQPFAIFLSAIEIQVSEIRCIILS